MKSLQIAVASLFILLLSWRAYAEEPAPFARHVVASYVVNDAGLLDCLWTEDVEIKSQSSVGTFGQFYFDTNTHFYKRKIVEAYTQKPDGRRLPVATDKIIEADLPNASTLGFFDADSKRTTIYFPDLAAGDTVHYVSKLEQIHPTIFGHLDFNIVVASSARYASFVTTLDEPIGSTFKSDSRGFTTKIDELNGRRTTTWVLQPLPYSVDEQNAVALVDRNPYIAGSDFKDWTEISRAYQSHASPMAEPTPEIRALAEQITKDKTGHLAETEAIFDWVSTNIRYVAIYLGQGGWVPHSASSVLQNKYGDCKDHTTLLQALLGARGIASDIVAINLGTSYQTPGVPTPRWFNHVIVYLPEFDRYVDPTSPFATIGGLPWGDADKYVLHLDGESSALRKTPSLSAAANQITLSADVTLRSDGTSFGSSVTTAIGLDAQTLRYQAMQAVQQGGDALGKRLLANLNWHGTATIEPHDPADHLDPFALKASFDLTNNFFEESDARNALPTGPRFTLPSYSAIVTFNRQKNTQPFLCSAETYRQSIDFHLPDGVSVTNIPKDLTLDQPLASLRIRYIMDGRTLHAEREFVSRVPAETCTSERAKELKDIAEKAAIAFAYRPEFTKPE